MNQYSGIFIDNCEKFYHTKSTLYYEPINKPERILKKRLEDIQKRKEDLIRIKSSMLDTLESLQNTSTALIDAAFIRTETITEKIYEYFRFGNRTKLSVSDLFHSKNFITDLSQIRQFLQEIATHGTFLFVIWITMAATAKYIWGQIINDRDFHEYYVYRNYTDFLGNVTQVKDEIDMDFWQVRSENNMRFVVGNMDALFLDAVREVQMELMKFNISTIFDEKAQFSLGKYILPTAKLYRNYSTRGLRHVCSFVRGIGGSLGLFIGASVITLFQTFDLLGTYIADRKFKRKG